MRPLFGILALCVLCIAGCGSTEQMTVTKDVQDGITNDLQKASGFVILTCNGSGDRVVAIKLWTEPEREGPVYVFPKKQKDDLISRFRAMGFMVSTRSPETWLNRESFVNEAIDEVLSGGPAMSANRLGLWAVPIIVKRLGTRQHEAQAIANMAEKADIQVALMLVGPLEQYGGNSIMPWVARVRERATKASAKPEQ